jgi:predicted  nucleic acid-binding Zn-ribbon protein
MTVNELLRELHRLHLKIHDLREEAERAPRRLRAAQAKIDAAVKVLQDHLEGIKRLKINIHQKETTIKEHEAKIERYQSQMKAITKDKEYQALRHEIENERMAIAVHEDQILDLMLQVEQKQAQIPALETEVQKARAEYAKVEAEVGGRRDELYAQLAQAESDLKQIEQHLNGDLKKAYERLVKAHGGAEALCELRDGYCSGCQTQATLQQRIDAAANRIVLCNSCGKLLYLSAN